MSVYRTAIDLTIDAVDERARNFRNQVVTVVAGATCTIGAVVALRMLWPLFGFFNLIPICGLFLWLDAVRLAHWRLAIFALWAQRNVDLQAFGHAVRAVPQLPEATLTSMLSLLGTAQVGKIEAQASVHTRQAVATVVQFTDTLALRQLAAKVCAAAQSWRPLGMVTAVLLLPLVLRWLKASLQRQSRVAIMAARQHPDFDADTFRLLIEQFPLGGGQLAGDGWIDAARAHK
jgi:NAD(P)H-dependent FMN reductase